MRLQRNLAHRYLNSKKKNKKRKTKNCKDHKLWIKIKTITATSLYRFIHVLFLDIPQENVHETPSFDCYLKHASNWGTCSIIMR